MMVVRSSGNWNSQPLRILSVPDASRKYDVHLADESELLICYELYLADDSELLICETYQASRLAGSLTPRREAEVQGKGFNQALTCTG